MPFFGRNMIGMGSAGHREGYQRFDRDGNPLFIDDPVVDAYGTPIQNSAGEAFDFVMPAFRQIMFSGDANEYQQIKTIAERAGRLAIDLAPIDLLTFIKEWRFSSPEDVWWAIVFEIAWQRCHPLLVADKQIWLPAEEPSVFLPYDQRQIKLLAEMGMGPAKGIPNSWIKKLPEAFIRAYFTTHII